MSELHFGVCQPRFEERFWLVWRQGGGAPTFQHPDEESAQREAKRLARNNPGVKFWVLEATGCAIKQDVEFWSVTPRHTVSLADLPF